VTTPERQEERVAESEFEVVTARIVGNDRMGFRTEHYPNGERFPTKAEAIRDPR
jgi:hypothetical protein